MPSKKALTSSVSFDKSYIIDKIDSDGFSELYIFFILSIYEYSSFVTLASTKY